MVSGGWIGGGRLRYLLLFALRALLVLLLVLAFAHPFVRRQVLGGNRANEVTVLAIDNSLSMRGGTKHDGGESPTQQRGEWIPRTARRHSVRDVTLRCLHLPPYNLRLRARVKEIFC